MLIPLALTSLAMVAFAANSLLARAALGEGAIDAAGYTAIRLVFGALVLFATVQATMIGWGALRGNRPVGSSSWASPSPSPPSSGFSCRAWGRPTSRAAS